jgi:hypothetical protein
MSEPRRLQPPPGVSVNDLARAWKTRSGTNFRNIEPDSLLANTVSLFFSLPFLEICAN